MLKARNIIKGHTHNLAVLKARNIIKGRTHNLAVLKARNIIKGHTHNLAVLKARNIIKGRTHKLPSLHRQKAAKPSPSMLSWFLLKTIKLCAHTAILNIVCILDTHVIAPLIIPPLIWEQRYYCQHIMEISPTYTLFDVMATQIIVHVRLCVLMDSFPCVLHY